MRRFALAIAVTALVTSCSLPGANDSATSTTAAPTSAPGAQTMDAALIELPEPADLDEFADGKVVLRHRDPTAELVGWVGEFKARGSYEVVVDCVGAVGDVTIEVTGGLRWTSLCSGGTNSFRDETIPMTAKAYQLTVRVPPSARWAILVSQPS
jgi:hypothetical protein